MTAVPIVIISTSTFTRSGIQQITAQSEGRIQIAAMFGNFSEADAYLKAHQARALIIDDSLPKGVNLVKELKKLIEAHPGLAVIMITQRPTVSLVRLMLNLGTRAILHRDDDLDHTLNQAVHLAVAGGTIISPQVSQLLEHQPALPKAIDQRDIDVLQLLTDGLRAKEIAAQLSIDRRVVYRIIQKVSTVYDAQNIAQLVRIIEQRKLLPPRKE